MLLLFFFGKERQRNEQRFITHAYKATVLVTITAGVCLFNSLKPSNRQSSEQPSELKAYESQAEHKDGRGGRKHLCYETSFENQNI